MSLFVTGRVAQTLSVRHLDTCVCVWKQTVICCPFPPSRTRQRLNTDVFQQSVSLHTRILHFQIFFLGGGVFTLCTPGMPLKHEAWTFSHSEFFRNQYFPPVPYLKSFFRDPLGSFGMPSALLHGRECQHGWHGSSFISGVCSLGAASDSRSLLSRLSELFFPCVCYWVCQNPTHATHSQNTPKRQSDRTREKRYLCLHQHHDNSVGKEESHVFPTQ